MQESLSPEEIKAYQRLQQKIDESLVQIGAVCPAVTSSSTTERPIQIAKVTHHGLAKKDDPIYTGGTQVFVTASRPATATSPKNTDGTKPTESTSHSTKRPPMSPAKQMEARANAEAFGRELREKFKNGANLSDRDTP